MFKITISSLVALLFCSLALGQKKIDNEYLKKRIALYKNDIRGPYKDIRWFCADGSIRMPKDPCPDNIGPGVQHARYKDDVVAIGKDNHI